MSRSRKPPASAHSAEALICMAVQASPDAIVLTTPARSIVLANTAALKLFGYDAAEICQLSARDLYALDEDWAAVRQAIQDFNSTGLQHALAVTLRPKARPLFDGDVSVAPVMDASGAPCGVIETFRARPPQPIADRTLEGGQSIAAAVRLARGVAHDFNNLLAITTGNVQLASGRTTDPISKRYLREAELACEMGERLTQRLTAFAADRRLAPQDIALPALARALLSVWQTALGARTVLKLSISAACPIIRADRSALENAILNLVLNARDAIADANSTSPGSVTIAAETVRVSRSSSSAGQPAGLAEGNYVRLSVSDTGCGMPPRIKARAFDPFFTTKAPGRGTGLGLASVYGFAHQAGGLATIDSAPGRGTDVALYLPVAHAGPVKTG